MLSTQHADGSWLVSTRRRGPGLPYFETGFPHGEDQFISYAGTCWATLALCFSIDPVASPVFSRPEPHATRDARDTTELTPFLRAVLFDGAEAVKAQIAAGADVHAKGPGGVTALMCAAGDVDKTRVLLEHGAAVDVRSELGYTALIVAAGWNGGREVSLLLLEHGADVQARASDGMTALSRAVLAGDGVLTERLLAAGANLEPAEDTDLGPLACATEQGDAALVRELLARGAKYGGYPGDPSIGYLTGAVNDGLNDTVKALLAGGATVDEKDETGFTPLHWAAAVDFGDTEILELLLAKGADINARTSDQSTPLKLAMKYGNKRQEEILRQAGARE